MEDPSKKRANDIFNDALERPPTERSAFLQSACADDVALHAQVAGLLAAHAEAGEFLASPTQGNKGAIPPIETVELKPLTEGPGALIGRYKLLQPIGEGGFGVVYLAEQKEPVRRRVALKVIKLGMDTRQVVSRFEAERQALAMMEHPNIARVFDGGATESGRPYFVMELVKGVPITQYCDDNNLSIPERLGLFRQVCQAVQHAHQKGVIHRDLKPSNVMVTLHDGVPVPKVIDFGISKATNQRLTERTLFTEYGQFIGTPQYVAPEQAEMSGLDVDTRADIYSLGVLLYELLTGTTPLDAKSLRAAGYAEMQRMIKESESPKPSTRISTLGTANDVAKHRQTEPGKLTSQLRGDLDWIVLKALEKDRTRRYETANDLAADLQRHLDDEPVLAGPPSATYRLRKFTRRNRVLLSAVGLVVVALMLGLAGTAWQSVRATRERDRAVLAEHEESRERERAEEARDDAEQVTKFLTEILAATAQRGVKRITRGQTPRGPNEIIAVQSTATKSFKRLYDVLDRMAETIPEKFGDKPLAAARLREIFGWTYYELASYEEAERHLAEAAATYRQTLGEGDARTVRATAVLASVKSVVAAIAEGKYEASGDGHMPSTLEIRRLVLGDEHPSTLDAMHDLAGFRDRQGKFAEAESLYRRTLELRHRVLGEEHLDAVKSMNGLGDALFGIGRYAEAESLYRQMLEICCRVLGEENPDTLRLMNRLGGALSHQGRYAEAEELYRKTLEIQRRVLGEELPETRASAYNLAISLSHQGRYTEAETLYVQTLGMRRVVMDSSYEWREVASMSDLAELLHRTGKPDESKALYAGAIQFALRDTKAQHLTAVPFDTYASLLLTCKVESLRDPQAALPLAERAVKMSEGQNFRMLATLALAYQANGEIDRAVETQKKALALLLPEESPQRTDLEGKLGEYLIKQKNFAEAKPLLLKAHESITKRQYVPPDKVKEAIERLVELYESWDAAEPGKDYAEKAAEWRTTLPPDAGRGVHP